MLIAEGLFVLQRSIIFGKTAIKVVFTYKKGSTTMKNVIKENKPQVEPHIITSQNSPELAQRIRQASAAILKRNYNLYKELENK